MIKITNQKLIDFYKDLGIKNDLFFEPRSKFLYEIKYFGGSFYYNPVIKYSFNKIFALNLTK